MYLDTTERTELAFITGSSLQTRFACQTCHTGAAGAPPVGAGKVLPWRHVNGRRDVVFDSRTTVPAGYGSPQALWGLGNVLPASP
jgi:mono/diheme cytochrome c family protein